MATVLSSVWELVSGHFDGDFATADKKPGDRQTWAKARL